MSDLTLPPENIPIETWLSDLRQTAQNNLPLARRLALLRLLWEEAYFTPQGLIARVEAMLWPGCFGSSSLAALRRDLRLVRQYLAQAGHRLRYSRHPNHPGYYLEDRSPLAAYIHHLISGSVAEVDPRQMVITRQLTLAQRFQQGYSMTHLAEKAMRYRRRQILAEAKTPQPLVRERNIAEMTDPTMDFGDFMRLVLDALEAAAVEYMIGGAIAVWAWGDARTTRDFDLVVNIPFENILRLSQELEKRDMLVPAEIILDLFLKTAGDLPINAIHLYTGYKAELFLLRPGDHFRQTALARRCLVDLGPPLGQVYVHAPEDLILYKLRYFNLSHQPKHTRDIASILLALGAELDLSYLEQWAIRLGLLELWHEIQQGLQP
jgi:hypothetical protein